LLSQASLNKFSLISIQNNFLNDLNCEKNIDDLKEKNYIQMLRTTLFFYLDSTDPTNAYHWKH